VETNIAFAFLHHVAAFAVVATLTVELVLLGSPLTLSSARNLLRMDTAYGIAALLLLVAGFVRVFYTEKGAAYYFASGTFIAKIALFAVIGIISIYPTKTFLGWRPALRAQQVPQMSAELQRRLRRCVHAELMLIPFIVMLAVLMARGYGYFG
jgi:putative membrane protein